MRKINTTEKEKIDKEMLSGKKYTNKEMKNLSWHIPDDLQKEMIRKYENEIKQTTDFSYGGLWMKFWTLFGFFLLMTITVKLSGVLLESFHIIYIMVLLFLFWVDLLMGYLFFSTFILRRGNRLRKELDKGNYEILPARAVCYYENVSYAGEVRSANRIVYAMHDERYICVKNVVGSAGEAESVILLKFKLKKITKNEYEYYYVVIAK